MKFKVKLHTDGKGLWSNAVRTVELSKLEIGYINEEMSYGELRVFFTKKTWDPSKHGLIYTDDTFERELQTALTAAGLAGKDVSYSEQGMQGENYVSLDIGKAFLKSWAAKVL
jgi:hypothetical protein